MAIDYGSKRIGLAVTDPLQIIATGLTTVGPHEIINYLKKYFIENQVDEVVIGMPKNLQNQDTNATELVVQFIGSFKKNFPDIPIIEVDERFTSKMAFQSMIDSGTSKKDRRNKAAVDEISATIILQDYLISKS